MPRRLIIMGEASELCGKIASALTRDFDGKIDYYVVRQSLLEDYLKHILEDANGDYEQIFFIALKPTHIVLRLLDDSFKKPAIWIRADKIQQINDQGRLLTVWVSDGKTYQLTSDVNLEQYITKDNLSKISETFDKGSPERKGNTIQEYFVLFEIAQTIYDNTGETSYFYRLIISLSRGDSASTAHEYLKPYNFGMNDDDDILNIHGATLLDEAIRHSSMITSEFDDDDKGNKTVRDIVQDILDKMWDAKKRCWKKILRGFEFESQSPPQKKVIDFKFDNDWSPDKYELLSRRLIGVSYGLEKIRHQIASIHGNLSVMLLGDSGTGKENIAKLIHYAEYKTFSNFIPYNCANVNESLMKDDFFGHQKGAYTGATGERTGLLELADKGTLFLDEIGDMPLSIQGLLLRFLNDGTFSPQGTRDMKRASVRIICGTNKDMASLIRQEKFRADLFFRLAEYVINIPSLNERPEDIELIANSYLRMLNWSNGVRSNTRNLTPEEIYALRQYDYPGNVRELRNIIKRAFYSDDYNFAKLIAEEKAITANFFESKKTSDMTLATAEREHIQKVLDANHGKKKKTAEALGISFPALQRALKKSELQRAQKKSEADIEDCE